MFTFDETSEVALLLAVRLVSKAKKLTTAGTVRIEKLQLNTPQTTQTSSRMMLRYLGAALKGKTIGKFLIRDHGKSNMRLPFEFGQRLHCVLMNSNYCQTLKSQAFL